VALADFPQAAPLHRGHPRHPWPAIGQHSSGCFRIAFNNSEDKLDPELTPAGMRHVAAEVAAVSIDGQSDSIKTVTVQLVNGEPLHHDNWGPVLDP